jgi:hypothetical protein
MSLPPTSVVEFLSLHNLAAYSAAFEEQGWDDLAQLQAINESELLLLAADVSMKSGHVARLKKALGLTQPVPQPVHTASALPSASPTPAPAAPAPSPIPPVALAPAPAVAARSVSAGQHHRCRRAEQADGEAGGEELPRFARARHDDRDVRAAVRRAERRLLG